jgi:hypothetical protein
LESVATNSPCVDYRYELALPVVDLLLRLTRTGKPVVDLLVQQVMGPYTSAAETLHGNKTVYVATSGGKAARERNILFCV